MNILYIDEKYRLTEDYMYPYYGGLYRELCRLENVYLFEGLVDNINDLLNQFLQSDISIDCVIFGLGYFAQNDPQCWKKIEGMSELQIPTVAFLHKPQSMLQDKLNFCKINKISILADFHNTYKEFGQQVGCKSFRSWWTASPEIFYPKGVQKIYDIGFSGALHGDGKINGPTRDLRSRIQSILKSNSSYNIFWNGTDLVSTRIDDVHEYSTKINECKIWLSTTGPVLEAGPRYFEVLLSKTLLFCNNMPEQYETTFVDGENCVMFENDLSNFEDKLKYYLHHDDKRNSIIECGYNMAKNKYTWKHMAINLLSKIGEVTDE